MSIALSWGVRDNYMNMNRIENMCLDIGAQNCLTVAGPISCGSATSASTGSAMGGIYWMNGTSYPYSYEPNPLWWINTQPSITVLGVPPVIDYDLLAEKIADRIKGAKKRTKEEVRKEINKLLSELEKAK